MISFKLRYATGVVCALLVGAAWSPATAQGRNFMTANGGGFLSGAGERWFPSGGLGVGRGFSKNLGVEGELLVTHARVQTPKAFYGVGRADEFFDSPVTTINAIGRIGLPFARNIKAGIGIGLLDYNPARPDVARFLTKTWLASLSGSANVSRTIFVRLEGQLRRDDHQPFNSSNGAIFGSVGLRF